MEGGLPWIRAEGATRGGPWTCAPVGIVRGVNDYLREISGGDFTAKDFRTWKRRKASIALARLGVIQAAIAATSRCGQLTL